MAAGTPDLPAASPVPVQATAPAPAMEPVVKRLSLEESLAALERGQMLQRKQMIEAIIDLIEDGHSSDPQVFGIGAVDHLARLERALRQ